MPSASAGNTEMGLDIIAGLPCETAAKELYDANIVTGPTAHTFAPETTLPGVRMAAILVRVYGHEAVGEGKAFEDVPESH